MVVETRSARVRGQSPASHHSQVAGDPVTPRSDRGVEGFPSSPRPDRTPPPQPHLGEPSSPRSAGGRSTRGGHHPPAPPTQRPGKEPAQPHETRYTRGRGRGGRWASTPRQPQREDVSTMPTEFIRSVNAAVDRLERASFAAAASPVAPPTAHPTALPVAPPITQPIAPPYVPPYQRAVPPVAAPPVPAPAPQAMPDYGPRRPVAPRGDQYDHRYPDYDYNREEPIHRDPRRREDDYDRVDDRSPLSPYDRHIQDYPDRRDDPPRRHVPPPRDLRRPSTLRTRPSIRG